MQFHQVTSIKSNITVSMDMRLTYDIFGVLTRQLATASSKWVYRIEIYNFDNLQKQASIDVSQSYSEANHFIQFVSDKNLIVVNTNLEIRFYQLNPLELKKSYLHSQTDLYDLQASPDGELVVLVGNEISIWRTNGFRRVTFSFLNGAPKKCAFSRDNKYIAIATINQIHIYTYSRSNGQYLFTPFNQTFIIPSSYQGITSIEFNPTDSNQMVVGFLNVSPQFLQIDRGYFLTPKDIQPMASMNSKVATYMPDGKRFMSSDVQGGVSVWPGVKDMLFYKQGYFLHDILPNSDGTKFLGRNWQQIKLLQIKVECKPESFQIQCECPSDYSWDYYSYSCQPLSCLQKYFSTEKKDNNQCVCIEGYVYSKPLRKCVIDCSKIPKALNVSTNSDYCYCTNNYSWNSVQKQCVFDCKHIPFSTGLLTSTEKCQCNHGFIWSTEFNQCICLSYSYVLGSQCVCYENYSFIDGKCIVNCKHIFMSIGETQSGQQCNCQEGYYFTEIGINKAGCKLNCTNIPNTQPQSPSVDSCLCIQKMYWSDRKCKINCTDVEYASGQSATNQNQCNCAVNYLWVDEIHQCGRNCTGINHINATRNSTLKACPCINNFIWNQQKLICEIDCSKINNTNPYSLLNPQECECRHVFFWEQETFSCQINCSQIWDAKEKVDDQIFSCKNNKQFNQTRLTCDVTSVASFFTVGSVIGFVFSIIVFIIMSIVLGRYCWQFRTKNNKEHIKRLKSCDKPIKIRKNSKETKDLLQYNGPLTGDRFNTKITL